MRLDVTKTRLESGELLYQTNLGVAHTITEEAEHYMVVAPDEVVPRWAIDRLNNMVYAKVRSLLLRLEQSAVLMLHPTTNQKDIKMLRDLFREVDDAARFEVGDLIVREDDDE